MRFSDRMQELSVMLRGTVMNAPNPEPSPVPTRGDSDSSDSMIVEVIDTTAFVPRPLTGKRLELARAEKEKLDRYLREKAERERTEKEKADRERGDQPPPKPER